MNDHYDWPKNTVCCHCGEPCSGDTTERIEEEIDGAQFGGEFPVCDDPDNCPANAAETSPYVQLDSGIVYDTRNRVSPHNGKTDEDYAENWEAHLRARSYE